MDIGNLWQRTNSWRKKRRVQTFLAISLALFAPFLVFITFMVLRSTNGSVSNDLIRFVLLLDFIYVLVVGALVGQRILRMMIARSKKTAGSRLHLRRATAGTQGEHGSGACELRVASQASPSGAHLGS